MTTMPQQRQVDAAGETAGIGETLPGWTYHNAEFFELEKRHLLLTAWQLVCHVSEVRHPGDFATLEFLGERAFVIRGEDGLLRAFHNVCRHRAAAVVRGDSGSCLNVVRCFYHGWTYGFDGRLKAVPGESGFPGLDKARLGLKPLELEVYFGFAFVRFSGGGARLEDSFAPYGREFAAYRSAEMEPLRPCWQVEISVNWKNLMDNYLEGYHVPVGHPGLFRLFGNAYEVEAKDGTACRAIGWLRDRESVNWSERHYQRLLPKVEHLDEEQQRSWRYYSLLPNLSFDVYPEMLNYFQILPLSATRTRLRVRAFGLPTRERRLRAARWLNARINSQVQREDEALIASVQAGLATGAYGSGFFSQKEVCLRRLHDLVRAALPVARQAAPPRPGAMAEVNAALG
jgi:phenylpropionate dioxygenase-like ring-hydroxylating dioxygenase large terminal subunit